MSTNDPITTDRLAAAIRDGMTAQPLLTTVARPVADRLAVLIDRRLPNITAADTGAVMLHIAAFLADVMTVLTEQGDDVATAIQTATSAIAMAGVELYDAAGEPDPFEQQLRAALHAAADEIDTTTPGDPS